jgi:GrpB-like predicted nucleotidyltransferase (UPF0157 family)
VKRVAHDGRRDSNAEEDRVELVDYDPGWPALFEVEADRLRAILAGLDLGPFRLEHFGSTAIPGVTAKPIIDIMLVSAEPARWPGLIVRTPDDARPALVFCEYLRRHPDAVARYARLKRELEARHPTDREAYTAGKAEFVAEIVRQADVRP